MSHYRQSPPWKTAQLSLRWVATMRQLPAPVLGQRLNDMQAWCDRNAGTRRAAWFNWNHGAEGVDHLDWYFADEAVARRFIDRWPDFGLALLPNVKFSEAYAWQARREAERFH